MLDASLDEGLAAFLGLVSTLLQEKLGLSQKEATSAIENYADEHFARWESLANS